MKDHRQREQNGVLQTARSVNHFVNQVTLGFLRMRRLLKILLWGLLGSSAVVVATVGYVFVAARYFDSCGISESQARSMVLDHLASKDRAAEPRLNYYQNRGTCEHAFYYKGPAGEFDFVVIDDPGHGVTLTWWDFAREENPNQPIETDLRKRASPARSAAHGRR